MTKNAHKLTIFVLVFVLSMGSALIATMNTRYSVVVGEGNDSLVTQSVDFEYLAEKYQQYFVVHQNGIVSLDTGRAILRSQSIESQDEQGLQEYSNMLEKINGLVADGSLYINESGEYLMTDAQMQIRDLNGGRNEFYVKTKSIFFVPVPIGYHFSLGTIGAIAFGAITAVISWGTGLFLPVLLQGKAKTLQFMLDTLRAVNTTIFTQNFDMIFNILYGIYIVGTAINVALNATAPGVGAIVTMLISLISGYIFDTVGLQFILMGLDNTVSSNNTVVAETNLILQNRSFWYARY
ncbi:MAG: hypothetical protein LBU60_00990 [Clostridiales bacterium]|jgi:hypothetical protein|nr:hypothetical protein [Clostridiales bacterium]